MFVWNCQRCTQSARSNWSLKDVSFHNVCCCAATDPATQSFPNRQKKAKTSSQIARHLHCGAAETQFQSLKKSAKPGLVRNCSLPETFFRVFFCARIFFVWECFFCVRMCENVFENNFCVRMCAIFFCVRMCLLCENVRMFLSSFLIQILLHRIRRFLLTKHLTHFFIHNPNTKLGKA